MFKRSMVVELCRAFADLISANAPAAERTARQLATDLEQLRDDQIGAPFPAAL
jgi:hypothetical protein